MNTLATHPRPLPTQRLGEVVTGTPAAGEAAAAASRGDRDEAAGSDRVPPGSGSAAASRHLDPVLEPLYLRMDELMTRLDKQWARTSTYLNAQRT